MDCRLRTVVGDQLGRLRANHKSRSSPIVVRAPTAGATFACAAKALSSRHASDRSPCTVRVSQRRLRCLDPYSRRPGVRRSYSPAVEWNSSPYPLPQRARDGQLMGGDGQIATNKPSQVSASFQLIGQFLESGRRDSNPRPSPWQGGGVRPRRPAEASELASRLRNVHRIRGFNPVVERSTTADLVPRLCVVRTRAKRPPASHRDCEISGDRRRCL
jgi:hypothetical protein